jgi:hypothetical protein
VSRDSRQIRYKDCKQAETVRNIFGIQTKSQSNLVEVTEVHFIKDKTKIKSRKKKVVLKKTKEVLQKSYVIWRENINTDNQTPKTENAKKMEKPKKL